MNNTPAIHRAVLPVAALVLLALSACDTIVSEPEDPAAFPRNAAFAPTLSANVALWDSLLFDGLLHRPTGQAVLTLDPSGNLVISNIGSTGQDGVLTELPGVRGIRRTFEPIDLGRDGTTVSWQASAYPDSLPPLLGRLRLQNQGGAVTVGADFSALAPGMIARIYNDTLIKAVPVQAASANLLRVHDIGEGLVLKGLLSSPMGHAIAAEIEFAYPVSFDIQGQQVTGDRLRLALPNKTNVAFSGTVWRFLPSSGASRMDVVSTGIDVVGGGS